MVLTIEIDRGVEAVLICPIYNHSIQRSAYRVRVKATHMDENEQQNCNKPVSWDG